MATLTERLQRALQTAECAVGWTAMASNTMVFGSAAIAMSALDPTGLRTHPIGVAWARTNLKLVRSRTEVTGLENADPTQPYVLMANHQSHMDIWALFDAVPLQIRWVMKQELRGIPIFGTACERAGYIYVQRGNNRSARASMALAAERIAAGTTVVFFPEGTRSHDGSMGDFKTGGFRLALQAGVPILPVSIRGTDHMLARNTWRYNPGVARVHIGEPLPTAGRGPDDLAKLMAETRVALQRGLDA